MKDFKTAIKTYRTSVDKIVKNGAKLNESGTRLLVNDFLREVLGYSSNEEIKTEYEIGGGYADYVIQLGNKKRIVVEVKQLNIKLNENHLRQSLGYAAGEGIDWILLLNSRHFQLYKVIFAKPVSAKLVFNIDILAGSKSDNQFFELMSKKSMSKNLLDEYWKKVDSLSPKSLSKYLFDESVLKLLRKNLKNATGVTFSYEDIVDSLYKLATSAIDIHKPKLKIQQTKNKIADAKNVATNTASEEMINSPENDA